jgi:hypothetical protein
MQNNNYKNECSQVSTHVSDETKTWLDNMKNKYSIDISTQLFYVVSKMIKSEKQLEKIVVASLLDDHESRGNALREMARELGIEVNVNVADEIATRMVPVVNANVVDVFSKHKKTGVETANMINECLDKNSDVNTAMKSKLEEAVSKTSVSDEVIDWTRFGSYRYSDLDILGMAIKDYRILQEDNLRAGFMNGLYASLHNQALGLWSDEEKQLTIRQLVRLQPKVSVRTGEQKTLAIQSMVRRLFKAIVHFGTAEEKMKLFGTSEIYPYPRKRKAKKQ